MSGVKAHRLTVELQKLRSLSTGGESGILGVAVKCVDIKKNAGGEGGSLNVTDTDARKLGEQTGLDTLVVPAVNGVHLVWEVLTPSVPELTR